MHTKNYDQAYNFADLGIDSPDGNLSADHGDVQGNSNLYYQFFTGSRVQNLRQKTLEL